jgi:hypothetical protein
MDKIEKRYEKKVSLKPCALDKNDLLALAALIQETFTKPEIDRYFRVSTPIGDTRVFSNSMEDFLDQRELPGMINDLAFWIEGWDKETRFDKNILLDFSKYSSQLSIEGIDPVWVHDRYVKITKFLKKKTAWYWPFIMAERFFIFIITVLLISNIIISIQIRESFFYFDKAALMGLWVLLVFFDMRRIWPYSCFKLKEDKTFFNKESVFAAIFMVSLLVIILGGTVIPLIR